MIIHLHILFLIFQSHYNLCTSILGAKLSKQENLKEMGDVSSGMASTVIQLYLKEILESFLHPNIGVRHAALKVIQLILAQGLVHPVQVNSFLK